MLTARMKSGILRNFFTGQIGISGLCVAVNPQSPASKARVARYPGAMMEPPRVSMKSWIGTSGFQYTAWKGTFYPDDLPSKKMLPFYAERFSTTEINYTFHRIPSAATIDNWKQLTSESFRFALKEPQKIT